MTTPTESKNDGQSRCLMLMRHAKSDWDDESLHDHERPLNERGKNDAPRMGKWMVEEDLVPDVVLSSTATRTRETLQLMSEQWRPKPEVGFSKQLYNAGAEEILDTIRLEGLNSQRLLIIGHNPTIAHLASELASQDVDMPTGAVAVFEVEVEDWSHLRLSSPTRLTHFMRPKAL